MNLIRDISVIFFWINILSTIESGKCQKGRKRDMMEDIQKTANQIWTSIEKNDQRMSSIDNTMTLMSNRVDKIIDLIEHNKLNDKLFGDRLERLEQKMRVIESSMNDKISSITDSVDQINREVKRIDSESDGKLRKIMNIMSDTYELSKDVSLLMKGRSGGAHIGNGDNDGPEPMEEMQKKLLEQMSVVEISVSQQVTNVGKLSKQILSSIDNVNIEMINLRDECHTDRQSTQTTDKRDSFHPTVKSERDSHQCSNLNITELKHEIESQMDRISVKVENEMTVIESRIQEYMTTCNTNTKSNGRSIQSEGMPPLIVNTSSDLFVSTRKTINPALRPTRSDDCQHSSDLLAPKDCSELRKSGANCDGVYIITVANIRPLRVYCDMTDNGGGWTVWVSNPQLFIDYRFD